MKKKNSILTLFVVFSCMLLAQNNNTNIDTVFLDQFKTNIDTSLLKESLLFANTIGHRFHFKKHKTVSDESLTYKG